jgi:type IV secretory pathway VirB6-like protein
LLFFILNSCGVNDNKCIEADDFGNYDTEIIDVMPYISLGESQPSLCELKDGEREASYSVLSTDGRNILYNCLNSIQYKVSATTKSYLNCKNLYENEYNNCNNDGCRSDSDLEITDCEKQCMLQCLSSPNNSGSIPWKTNNPEGPAGNSVAVKPGSLIYMKVNGSIWLSDIVGNVISSNTLSIDGGFQGLKVGISKIVSNAPNLMITGFPDNALNYKPTINFRLLINGSQTQYEGASINDNNKLYGLLENSLLVFKKLPAGYTIDDAIPIEGDPEVAQCKEDSNSGNINNPKKLSCSEGNELDNYNAGFNVDLSTKAYQFGTDVNISEYGGYIRNSQINENEIKELNLTTSTLDSGVIKLNNSEYINLGNTDDYYLQLKITDQNCLSKYVNISIFDSSFNETYRVNNLRLSGIFSIEEIPLYKNSTIKISTPSCNSYSPQCSSALIDDDDDCFNKIVIQAKKYHDIVMPNSGFVQFKMQNIVNNTGGTITTQAQSCKLFGRIINPNGNKKLITKNLYHSIFQISNSSSISNPDSDNLDEGLLKYGIWNFANAEKSEINISTSCISSSSTLPLTCQNGTGINGGGGGNMRGTQTTKATSYANPEFVKTEPAPDSDLSTYGIGVVNSTGNDGKIIFEYYNSSNILETISSSNFSENTLNINANTKCKISDAVFKPFCVKFKIYGGSGGALICSLGSSAKAGSDGDRFYGTIDLEKYARDNSIITPAQLIYRAGRKGPCSGTLSPIPLAGGNRSTGIGHGGSASYIYFNRVDSITRNDFLVIAHGGNGGTASDPDNSRQFHPPPTLENNLFGFYYVKEFIPKYIIETSLPSPSAAPDINSFDNYHEYNYSFTHAGTDNDPLNLVDGFTVNNNSLSPDFFVRKGQIIRIYPEKSFYNQTWNSGVGQKECGVGMIMKITPRPAVMCLSSEVDKIIKNPECSPNFETTTNPDGTITTSAQKGCAITTDCSVAGPYKCSSPLKESKCYNIDCSTNTYGSETDARNCGLPTITANSCNCLSANASNNCNNIVDSLITESTCLACRTRKLAEANQSPTINLKYKPCYDFGESNNLSVNKFLKILSTITAINSNYAKQINNYPSHTDGLLSYGKFPITNMKKVPIGAFQTIATSDINFDKNGKIFGLSVFNNDFKTISLTSSPSSAQQSNLVFDTTFPAKFSQGAYLNITLCKESSDTSSDCTTTNEDIVSGKIIDLIKYPTVSTGNLNPVPLSPQYIKLNSFNEYALVIELPSSVIACPTPSATNINKNYICFANDLGNADQEKKYRMSFKIVDGYDNDYSNNSGKYSVELTVKRPNIDGLGLVNKILDPIIEKVDGKKDDPSTPNIDEEIVPFVSIVYTSIVNSVLYKNLLQITVVLLITFYGLGYLIGINEMKHSEIMKIILKIGIVYLFTSPTYGWAFFSKFFVEFFKNSIDFVCFLTAQIFENSSTLSQKILEQDFSNKGLLFISVDNVLNMLITSAVQNKIMALIFSSIWGWVYFLIILHSILLYFYAIANSVLLFITCQIITSILLSLAPIFFIMIFFNITKEIFDNWLKALIGFSLQQIFLIMTLSFFNILFVEFLKYSIGYRVCWTEILSFYLGGRKISLAHFWNVAGTNNANVYDNDDIDESFGSDENIPSLYSFLTLWIVVGMMKKFIELFTNLAVTIAGGVKASTISGDMKSGGQRLFGAFSGKATGFYQMTVGRAVSNLDNTLFASGKIAKEEKAKKQKQFTDEMKTRASLMTAGNDAVSNFKKNNALELSSMTRSEQKQALEQVRNNAMEKYAAKKNIGNYETILNKTGLNYQGTNLFGAVAQAGKQAFYSGGNLSNSGFDRKVKTTFSKKEAQEALARMKDPATGKDLIEKQNQFIKNIEEGKINVNRGKLDIAKDSFYTVKDTLFGDKSKNRNLVTDNLNSAKNFINQKLNLDEESKIKKQIAQDNRIRAINELTAEGKIKPLRGEQKGMFKIVVGWTRTDKEKQMIRDKVREYNKAGTTTKDKETVNLGNIYSDTQKRKTSLTVIRDLKNTVRYNENRETKGEIYSVSKNFIDRLNPLELNKSAGVPNFDSVKMDISTNVDKIKKDLKIVSNADLNEALKFSLNVKNEQKAKIEERFDEMRKNNPAFSIISNAKNLDLNNPEDRKKIREEIDLKRTQSSLPHVKDSFEAIENRLKSYETNSAFGKFRNRISEIFDAGQKNKTKNLEQIILASDPSYKETMDQYKKVNGEIKNIENKMKFIKSDNT